MRNGKRYTHKHSEHRLMMIHLSASELINDAKFSAFMAGSWNRLLADGEATVEQIAKKFEDWLTADDVQNAVQWWADITQDRFSPVPEVFRLRKWLTA